MIAVSRGYDSKEKDLGESVGIILYKLVLPYITIAEKMRII